MRVFAIRHTSVAVEPGICYGQSNVAVSYSFQKEKVKTSEQIQNIQFDKVYSSPLHRCKILAENLFEKEHIIYDDRLKELNFGDWELKTWDAIYSDPKGKIWMDNYPTLPTLNGESYPEMVKRVTEFLQEIKCSQFENIAIVAHAGVIRILKSCIEKQTIDVLFKTFKPKYGSVTEFEL